jgi:RNA polymerase sigma-70 factor, ECF subfamily
MNSLEAVVLSPTGMKESIFDESTLNQARQGVESACRELVICHQAQVFALLSRMLRSAGRLDKVEDLAQETFLRVFRNLSQFSTEGPARLSTWILTIASRLAIDELRHHLVTLVDLSEVTALPQQDSLENSSHHKDLGRMLMVALNQLDPEWHAMFLLYAYHDFSYQEIAESQGIALGTVKSRLARIKEKLQEALSEVQGDLL